MDRKCFAGTVLLAVLLGGAGCSAGLRGSTGALRAGDPTQAALLARDQLARDGGDGASWRDLGIAAHRLGRPGEALDALDRALEIRPDDRQALLFRARALDALGRLPEALAAYGAYLPRAHGKDEELARARIEQLRRRQIDVEVRRAIAREDSLAATTVPENSIAVPDFANPAESDTLRPIAKGLTVMTLTDLSQIERLRVLERQRLNTILEELRRAPALRVAEPGGEPAECDPIASVRGQQQRLAGLTDPSTGKRYYEWEIDGIGGPRFAAAVRLFQQGRSLTADGIAGPKTLAALEEEWEKRTASEPAVEEPAAPFAFDPDAAPRIGRLMRARQIVQGSVVPLGSGAIQLSAILQGTVADAGDRSGASDAIEGSFEDLLKLHRRLVFEIIDLLGITLTKEEHRAIERGQTKDLKAFLAFCRGLDYEDRGLQEEAITQYREAFARDSGFHLAGQAATALSIGASDLEQIETTEIGGIPGSESEVSVADRAVGTGKQIGIVPGIEQIIGIDAATPDDQRPQEQTGRVVVEGDLPNGGKR